MILAKSEPALDLFSRSKNATLSVQLNANCDSTHHDFFIGGQIFNICHSFRMHLIIIYIDNTRIIYIICRV